MLSGYYHVWFIPKNLHTEIFCNSKGSVIVGSWTAIVLSCKHLSGSVGMSPWGRLPIG